MRAQLVLQLVKSKSYNLRTYIVLLSLIDIHIIILCELSINKVEQCLFVCVIVPKDLASHRSQDGL